MSTARRTSIVRGRDPRSIPKGGRRAGYLLGEMAVVLALTGAVVSMATVSLHTVYRMQQRTAAWQQHRAELARLADGFRRDTHRARSFAWTDDAHRGVLLELPEDATVEYRTTNRGIARLVRRAGSLVHQDRFRLLPRTRVHWSCETDQPRDVLTISLLPPGDRRSGPPVGRTIQAAVNVWQVPLAAGSGRSDDE